MKKVVTKASLALFSSLALVSPAFAQIIVPECPAELQAKNLCSLTRVITIILNAILAVVGIIALIYLVIGGLRYITSSGNPDAVEGAKNQILYAIIGIIVVVLAWALVNFVLFRLFGSPGTTQ